MRGMERTGAAVGARRIFGEHPRLSLAEEVGLLRPIEDLRFAAAGKRARAVRTGGETAGRGMGGITSDEGGVEYDEPEAVVPDETELWNADVRTVVGRFISEEDMLHRREDCEEYEGVFRFRTDERNSRESEELESRRERRARWSVRDRE